jgi:hypothetical protein
VEGDRTGGTTPLPSPQVRCKSTLKKTKVMNKKLNSILSAAAFSSALFFLAIGAHAGDAATTDSVALRLAVVGSIPVKNAGPFVEIGSYRIWVRSKLGAPSAQLSDGTWLYNNFKVDNSTTGGTVVIRFDQGRVSGMSLVSPAVATAMLKTSSEVPVTAMLASH